MQALQLGNGSVKGTVSTEPLIDHDAQRVLVTGRARLAPQLLGCHVGDGPGRVLQRLAGTGSGDDQPKVAEQDFAGASQQHILWLDVAMDQLVLVRIL